MTGHERHVSGVAAPGYTDKDKLEDVKVLHGMGYAQELDRRMKMFSNFAISFSIISILTGAVTLYSHGLVVGGPAEMAFGWPLVSLFTLAVAVSMAELARRTRRRAASSLVVDPRGRSWGWITAWLHARIFSSSHRSISGSFCFPRPRPCRRLRHGRLGLTSAAIGDWAGGCNRSSSR
jgi:hypothetical protein